MGDSAGYTSAALLSRAAQKGWTEAGAGEEGAGTPRVPRLGIQVSLEFSVPHRASQT